MDIFRTNSWERLPFRKTIPSKHIYMNTNVQNGTPSRTRIQVALNFRSVFSFQQYVSWHLTSWPCQNPIVSDRIAREASKKAM